MGAFKKSLSYFTKGELALWGGSAVLVLGAFFWFDRENPLILAASLLGVTSLLFSAKGNPFGQVLMVVFSLLYGYISWGFAYYGEMLTYVGMTAPMSLYALISWLKNPYGGRRSQVKIRRLACREVLVMALLALLVTMVFYFILAWFSTRNLLPSTLSVSTSFLSVYLTARRSPYFALCYAANDLVLVLLWSLAALENKAYLSTAACFAVFLLNDSYTFVNWRRMQARQEQEAGK